MDIFYIHFPVFCLLQPFWKIVCSVVFDPGDILFLRGADVINIWSGSTVASSADVKSYVVIVLIELGGSV
ncbi:uncharacterized protein LOC125760663 isoform X2 [Anopheles funestus]|uniref:uncharacterized protein LOC125760663 isoform X2 n=1 Tax=Anopheles funestus TaxID=62324 RepID=UPI0020C5B4A4|nr:uncharacterized protein LOC125760663 isoform X2 [Anopheles funestus]